MKSTEYETSVVTDLPEANADECLASDSLRTDAASDAAIASTDESLISDRLIVVDGSDSAPLDLEAVGRSLLRFELDVDDASKLVAVETWSEFFTLLARFDAIDHLVILVESSDGAFSLDMGGESLALTSFVERLADPLMPDIGSIAIDGCRIGAKINWMLELAETLDLSFLTAWPLFVGYSPISEDWVRQSTDAELVLFLIENDGYVLGKPTIEEVRDLGSMCLAWVQTSQPTPEEFPRSAPTDRITLADYRESLGYWQRWAPYPIMVPSSTPKHSDVTIEIEAYFATIYSILMSWDPDSGKSPYDYITITYIY